jgi:hypothetical protein
MAIELRDKFQIVFRNSVAASTSDTQLSAIFGIGDKVYIDRVMFADRNLGNNVSGGFLFEWGSGGSFEIIAAAYLTGNTAVYKIDRTFTGDGVKRFRLTRQNNNTAAKELVIIVEGNKRN